jgi:hypothetical protein
MPFGMSEGKVGREGYGLEKQFKDRNYDEEKVKSGAVAVGVTALKSDHLKRWQNNTGK